MAGGFPKKFAKWQHTLEDSVIPTCKLQEGLTQIANMVCGLLSFYEIQQASKTDFPSWKISFFLCFIYYKLFAAFFTRAPDRILAIHEPEAHHLIVCFATLMPFQPSLFLNIQAANGMVTRVITTIGSKSGETAARDAPSI